jgi:hypothetical protein
MRHTRRFSTALILAASAILGAMAATANAEGPFRRRPRPAIETATTTRPEDQVAPSPMLGSFRPSNYVTVRGNGVVGGGYSPLGQFGREQSLSVYGPLSAFREISAPVTTVVRGYNGIPVVARGTSFSNPNQPTLSPYVYPTRASQYSALRFQSTPPQWDKAILWIDQN